MKVGREERRWEERGKGGNEGTRERYFGYYWVFERHQGHIMITLGLLGNHLNVILGP